MHKLVLVGCLMSAVAFAAEPAGPTMETYQKMGWTPRKVTKEDKKGVEATLDAVHKGYETNDLQAVMSNLDFPVMMVTDDSQGMPMAMMADQAQWQKMMDKNMKAMGEDKELAAQMAKMPKPKHEIFFVTDSLVMVNSKGQMPLGKGKMETRTSHLMVNKGGKWMVKSMVEGGWGDSSKSMMTGEAGMPEHQMKPAASSGTTPPKG